MMALRIAEEQTLSYDEFYAKCKSIHSGLMVAFHAALYNGWSPNPAKTVTVHTMREAVESLVLGHGYISATGEGYKFTQEEAKVVQRSCGTLHDAACLIMASTVAFAQVLWDSSSGYIGC